MYCIKCGQELPDNAVFCSRCGTKVAQSLNNQEVYENSKEDITVIQQNGNQPSITEENSSTSRFSMLGGLMLLLILVGCYFLYSSSPNSSTQVTKTVRTDTFMNGDPEESIQRILGKPLKIRESQADKETTREYSYDGVSFTTKAGKINYIKKDLKIINDTPIKRGDRITKVRWYRGAPLRYEQNLIQANDVDLVKYNLYEYADYVVFTQVPIFENNSEVVTGFLPKGAYKINTLDFDSNNATDNWKYTVKFLEKLGAAVLYHKRIEPKVKILEISSPVMKEIPLKVAEGNNNPATVSPPAVSQNPANSNSSKNGSFIVGQDITIKGTYVNMRDSYSRSSNVIGVFDNGEKVEYLGEHFVRQDGIWMNVKRKSGMTGWVFAAYVKEMYAETNAQSTNSTTQAKDVFVEHWNYENVDVYVVDKSITSGTSGTDKFFKVTVKQVQNGKLIKSNEWSFSQYRGEWRYKTDEMKGTTSTVFNNKIFEHCMKQLGWPYNVVNGGYYR